MKHRLGILAVMLGFVFTLGVGGTQAAIIVKDNNPTNLNLGASWVGGVAPGSGDIAQWDSTVGGANTVSLGADLNWAGIRILDPGGLAMLNAGNTLTLGAAGVDMSTATFGFTVNGAIVVAADQVWNSGGKQFSPWGPVDMDGHQVDLYGSKVQFKNTITGGGTLVVAGGQTQLSASTRATNTTVSARTGGLLVFDSASGVVNGTRVLSARLDGGTLSISGSASTNSIDTIANALTINSRDSTVTITPSSSRNARLAADSLARNPGATAIFRGTSLGLNPIGAIPSNSANIVFTTGPALAGAGGAAGSTTVSILAGVIGDTSAAGNGYGATGGLVTYDSTYGVRLLNTATEYSSALTDGQSQLDNVRLTNGSGTPSVITLNSPTTINALSFSVTATNAGLTIAGAGSLILNSGAIWASDTFATSGATEKMIVTNVTVDLNGREGIVHFSTSSLGGSGTGGGLLEIDGVIANDGGNGVTFSGNSGAVRLAGPTTNTYTGITTLNGGNLFLDKSVNNASIPGNLVINGGNVIDTGNEIADTADITINNGALQQKAGLNSGTGASETFHDLFMTGGTYNDGVGGTSSGSTFMRNATLSGGTWNVNGAHATYLSGSLSISNGAVLAISRAQDTTRNTILTVTNGLAIANTASSAYTPISIGGGNAAGVRGGQLTLLGDVTFTGNLSNTNPAIIGATAPTSGGGTAIIALNGTRTFDIGDGAADIDLLIAPAMTNNGATVGGLTKAGAGTLALTGTNTYAGPTTVTGGTLVVNGLLPNSIATVYGGSTLSGAGLIRSLIVNAGGTLSPGNSPGTLTVTSNLTFSSGAVFSNEFQSVALYDRVVVGDGTVSLDSATLALNWGSYLPEISDTFTIIDNQSANAIDGVFASLAEGAVATTFSNGRTATISYVGGTGDNDVTLTVVIPEPNSAVLLLVGAGIWLVRRKARGAARG